MSQTSQKLTVDDFYGPEGLIAKVKENYQERAGQRECSATIQKTIADKVHFLGECGTGFGKSFTVLVPAIIEAVTAGKRVVITTGTIALQEQYYYSDIPALLKALEPLGITFDYALAKGRSNYLCKAKLNESIATGKGTPLQMWAADQQIGLDLGDYGSAPDFCTSNDWLEVAAEEECERKACQFYGDGPFGGTNCFVFEALRKRMEAQIVVTNHTMFLLDLWLGNGSSHPILGDYSVAIIDEAHELPEKAQQSWGSEVGPKTISKSIKLIEKMLTRSGIEGVFEDGYMMGYQMMEEEIFKPFSGYLKESQPLSQIQAATDKSYAVAEEVAAELRTLNKKLKDLKAVYGSDEARYDVIATAQDRLSRLYTNLLRVYGQNVGDEPDTRWLSYLEPRYNSRTKDKYAVLHSKPITVAPLLNTLLFSTVPSVIAISATTRINGSFNFMRRELGMPKDTTVTFVGESPFDYEKNVEAYFPTHLPEPNADDYESAMAAEIQKLIEHGQGKALVLFTSVKLMESVFDKVSRRVKYECFVQGSAPKMRLLEKFKEDTHSCLFATRSFFTGIDVPGEALSTVILTRAPFRVPTEPLFAARCALIEEAGGNSFSDYSLPLMLLDIRQAFGRLIRTESDKGMFALLDSRAMKKSYGGNIRRSLPDMQRLGKL